MLTPIWQLPTLPSVPEYSRATPARRRHGINGSAISTKRVRTIQIHPSDHDEPNDRAPHRT
jgi:hypothetical protein